MELSTGMPNYTLSAVFQTVDSATGMSNYTSSSEFPKTEFVTGMPNYTSSSEFPKMEFVTGVANSTPSSEFTNTTAEGFSADIFKWHGAEILFLFMMFLAGVLGNTMVLYIYHFRWRQSNFSLFIQALALLDLTNSSLTVPIFIVITLNENHYAFEHLCQAASFIAIMTALASGAVLVIIAFDRNRKICKPLKREISLKCTRRLCMIAVGIGAFVSIPSIFVYGRKQIPFEDSRIRFTITQCFFTDDAMDSPLMFVFLGALGLTFMSVMTALCMLYVSMWKALKVHLARRESLGSRRPSTTSHVNNFRSQKSSAKLFFFVTVAFFASYFPYFIAVTIFFIDEDILSMNAIGKSFTDIAKLSPLMSNAINPLIYSITSTRFRKECKAIFKMCKRIGFRRTDSARSKSLELHVKTHTSSTVD